MNRIALAMLLLLPACSVVPGASGSRQTAASSAPSARVNAPPPMAQNPADRQCLAQLGAAGARFEALPDRYFAQGCSTLGTVQMHALAGDRGALALANIGPVTCPVSAAFAAWARYGVDRAAQQAFGQPLASIQTMGSYSCRNVAGSQRRSGHASASAIDIGGFVLADGTTISVEHGWNGSTRERQFLRLVQLSACRRFDTVLGPDYNTAHRDHLHLEGVIGDTSYCR